MTLENREVVKKNSKLRIALSNIFRYLLINCLLILNFCFLYLWS